MSRSTISTFKLFELFPDEPSACKYLEGRLWPMIMAVTPLSRRKASNTSQSSMLLANMSEAMSTRTGLNLCGP